MSTRFPNEDILLLSQLADVLVFVCTGADQTGIQTKKQ